MALSKLDEAAAFLSKHNNGLVAAAAAAESVSALRSDGNALALSEFEATMRGSYHHQGFAVESTAARTTTTRGTATTTTTTSTTAAAGAAATTTAAAAAATQTRLRSLARALVAGGGPEASSPSVVAFLSSEKEARR